MKKILIVSPIPIIPPDQGDKICILAYAQTLCEFSEVHFLIANGQENPPSLSADAAFKSVGHLRLLYLNRLSEMFNLVVRKLHPLFFAHRLRENVLLIARYAERLGVSHIHFEFSFFAAIAWELEKMGFQVSLRMHNIEAKALLLIDPASTHGLRRWFYRLIQRSVNRHSFSLEAQLVGKLSRAQTLSYGDQRLLRESGVDIDYIPPPFPDLLNLRSSYRESRVLRLLFLGGIGNETTGGGLVAALKQLFPDHRPSTDFTLTIAGAGTDAALNPWRSHPSVHFTGYVSDTEPYWNKCDVLFAPLHVRRGVRIKLIEALSRGVCVLASRQAAYGFPPDLSERLLLYDSENELPSLVSELQTDRPFLHENALAARRLYDEYFNPNQLCSKLKHWHLN